MKYLKKKKQRLGSDHGETTNNVKHLLALGLLVLWIIVIEYHYSHNVSLLVIG
jgi:hypothetical protein